MTTAGSALRKRSVLVAGHKTSVSLEAAFWDELRAIATARSTSVNALIAEIDETRSGNLSSAIRLYVLDWLRGRAGGGR
jgi:predicted DNA-binding ribbon-helix-helix protein